jgi:hypothetical protein
MSEGDFIVTIASTHLAKRVFSSNSTKTGEGKIRLY